MKTKDLKQADLNKQVIQPLKNLTTTFDKERVNTDRKFAEVNAQIGQLVGIITALTGFVNGLSNDIDDLEDRVNDLENV